MREVIRLLNDILVLVKFHQDGILPTKEVLDKIVQKVQRLQQILGNGK